MSNSLVQCAVAAAIAAVAVNAANATDISTYTSHQNVNVYISGSTAVDNMINWVLTGDSAICLPGTTTFYEEGARKEVVDYTSNQSILVGPERLWYCQAGSASGIREYTGTYLAIFKESAAGSINGVAPLIAVAKGQNSGLTFFDPRGPDLDSPTCASGPDAGSGCTSLDFTYNVAPTGGVADVEASLLRNLDGSTLSPSDINFYISGSPGYDVVLGLAADKSLFYALQHAEGLDDGSVTSACSTPNNDSPLCAPSISREQVASLLLGPNNNGGDLLSWNQFVVGPNSTPLNNGGDNNVYICRRDVGSGIEAAFEASFLGARCGISSETMAKEDGQFVVETWPAETVDEPSRCLEAFDEGGIELEPYSGDQTETFPAFTPAGNQWAIGITTTELDYAQVGPESIYHDTTRLLAIDGVLPTLENVVNGFYPYFSTNYWYRIASGQGVSTGSPLAVFLSMQEAAGNPVFLADSNSLYYENAPWGDGGDVATASNWITNSPVYPTLPVTRLELEQNGPINLWTKGSTGTVNNCDTPVLYGNVAAGLSEGTVVEGADYGSNYVNSH